MGINEISNKKLGVGVPLSFPMCNADFADSLVMTVAHSMMKGIQMEYIRKGNGPLDELRNIIVRAAHETACTHLVMVDADMWYPEDTFSRMLPQCTEEHPLIGALTFRRYPPFTPLLLKGDIGKYEQIDKWEDGSVVSVDATGTGCLMMHMSIFDKVDMPWFKFDVTEDSVVGEDIGFCSKVRKLGYPILVDTSVETHHLTTLHITKSFWRLYSKLLEQKALLAEEEIRISQKPG